MSINREELGRRLRAAREACGLTQQQVGGKLQLSRATVAQMELGNREVTSLELDKLAYLYGRDIRSFLAGEFSPQDALTVLFRTGSDLAENEKVADDLRRCIALGRELSNLERLLNIERDYLIPAAYPLGVPANKWEAIQQGNHIAQEERRRLDLGDGSIVDVAELLDSQGIRAVTLPLPEDVSGLTVREEDVGILVAANESHSVLRRRFSYAHEYAHVLLDRDRPGTISRGAERDELLEVRANTFAASFLMPEPSVKRFVASLGKGQPSRASAEVFDEQAVVSVQRRSRPGSQVIQIYDLVQLASAFGVSTIAALYRLRNIRPPLVTEAELARLRELIDGRIDKQAAEILGLPDPDKQYPSYEYKHRFLGLALEAFRQELISESKLIELARLVQVAYESLAQLVEKAGIDTNGESQVI